MEYCAAIQLSSGNYLCHYGRKGMKWYQHIYSNAYQGRGKRLVAKADKYQAKATEALRTGDDKRYNKYINKTAKAASKGIDHVKAAKVLAKAEDEGFAKNGRVLSALAGGGLGARAAMRAALTGTAFGITGVTAGMGAAIGVGMGFAMSNSIQAAIAHTQYRDIVKSHQVKRGKKKVDTQLEQFKSTARAVAIYSNKASTDNVLPATKDGKNIRVETKSGKNYKVHVRSPNTRATRSRGGAAYA